MNGVVKNGAKQRMIDANKSLHGGGCQGDLVSGNSSPARFQGQIDENLLCPICFCDIGERQCPLKRPVRSACRMLLQKMPGNRLFLIHFSTASRHFVPSIARLHADCSFAPGGVSPILNTRSIPGCTPVPNSDPPET